MADAEVGRPCVVGSCASDMVLHRESDGSVWAESFPSVIAIARPLLENAREELLSRRFRTVAIRLTNGSARYRLERRWRDRDCYLARKIGDAGEREGAAGTAFGDGGEFTHDNREGE